MKKVVLFFLLLSTGTVIPAQKVADRLEKAWNQFAGDSQLKYAMLSLYVVDARTGAVVFDRNSRTGLAPASTQKIITSITSFELLGKDYRYQTRLGYSGKLEKAVLKGRVYVSGSGDPSFGSWRWPQTKEKSIIDSFVLQIKKAGIRDMTETVMLFPEKADPVLVPDGWIYQDIGNYYGAGAGLLNWRENQFDVFLRSGTKTGDPVTIVKTEPRLYEGSYISYVTSAAKGTGDNAWIYTQPRLIKGTIPVNETAFKISGAILQPAGQFIKGLADTLLASGVDLNSPSLQKQPSDTGTVNWIYTHYSPPLDSLIWWFNQKSINLYGEALIKTVSREQNGQASTDSGLAILRRFWKEKGIDPDELNLYDGSGLSPLNRVTTHAQVSLLQFARNRPWFPSFFASLPVYNGMKMKSGTISDVKGFCGYHTARDGREFIFSLLVNNYSGRASQLVNKMYILLDELKK